MPFDDSLYGQPTGWFHQGVFGDGTSADFPDGIGGEPGDGGDLLAFTLTDSAANSGIGNLSTTMTIAGASVATAVSPYAIFRGQDATASDWAPWAGSVTGASGGGNLIVTSGGAGVAPTVDNDAPFTDNTTQSAEFFGDGTATSVPAATPAHYYYHETQADWDWSGGDVVWEAVVAAPNANSGTYGVYAHVNNVGAEGVGFYHINTGPYFAVYGGGSVTSLTTTPFEFSTWYHLFGVWNVNASSGNFNNMNRWYVNGILQTGFGVPDTPNTITVATSANDGMVIGARAYNNANGYPLQGKIAWLACWKQANWLGDSLTYDTGADAIALQRFQQLVGAELSHYDGTSLPSTMTRSAPGYLDKVASTGRREFFRVGDNWGRLCSRQDKYGTTKKGWLIEDQGVQEVPDSNDLSTANWSDNAVTSYTGTVASPFENLDITGIVPDSGLNTCWGVMTATYTASGNPYTLSAVVRAGNKNWIWLTEFAGADSSRQWFNIKDGYVGTSTQTGSGVAPYGMVERLNDDFYRCTAFFSPAAAAGHNIQWRVCDDDNTTTVTGDGATVAAYIGLLTFTEGEAPQSYIPQSGTGTVTRGADSLIYVGDDGNTTTTGTMSIACKVLLPEISSSVSDTDSTIVSLYESGTEYLTIRKDEDHYLEMQSAGGGVAGLITGSTAIDTNRWTQILTTHDANAAEAYLVETSQGTDSTANIPNGVTAIYIGRGQGASTAFNGGLVTDVSIYKKVNTSELGGIGTPVSYGSFYVSTAASKEINTTAVIPGGTTTAGALLDFTMPSNFRLTYGGQIAQRFQVVCSYSISKASGATDILYAEFGKNGTADTTTTMRRDVTSQNIAGSATIIGDFELSQNDYVEVFMHHDSGAETVTVHNAKCVIFQIPAT